MSRLSYRAYARHRGCTLRAVQKAIEAGRIPVVVDENGRKWIDPVAADKAWTSNTDPAKQSLLYGGLQIPLADDPADLDHDLPEPSAAGPRAPGAPDASSPDGSTAAASSADVDPDTAAYRRERAAREAIKRETEQIELDRLRGRLVDVDEASRIAFTAFRSLRDALLNVPARIKDQVAAEADPLQVEHTLEAELTSVLAGFDVSATLRDTEPDDDDAE